MIKVITYGTFDCLHYGHYNLLKRAKDLGDWLIVGVSSDNMCMSKGKKAILDEVERMEIVSNLRFVDEVILEENMSQKIEDIKKNNVQIFVLGDDYKNVFPNMPEYSQIVAMGCKVQFLERTPEISTTLLKNKLLEQMMLDKNTDSLRSITNHEK